MKQGILVAFAIGLSSTILYGQVCTIAGSGTINWASTACQESGVSPFTSGVDIVVPSGATLNFPTDPSHTGSLTIYGTVTNNKANALWDGNVIVNSTGTLSLNAKLDIGSGSGCGKTLQIESGGVMTLNGSGGSDLLSICGVKIAQSGGSCTNCGTSPPTCPLNGKPYCEPSGGFTGPSGYDDNGYNAALPVELIFFKGTADGRTVKLEWATAQEENFSHFEVERSTNGIDFSEIGNIESLGGINTKTVYTFDNFVETSGRYYYRIKSVDMDESFEYSNTIAVQVGTPESYCYVASNPVRNRQLAVEILGITDAGGVAHFSLVDQLGHPCLKAELREGHHDWVLPHTLKEGVYFCRITGVGFPRVVKIMVLD
jgi:hypothetical protein